MKSSKVTFSCEDGGVYLRNDMKLFKSLIQLWYKLLCNYLAVLNFRK